MKYLVINQDETRSDGEITPADLEVWDIKGNDLMAWMEDHWSRGETPPMFLSVSMLKKALAKKPKKYDSGEQE
jgi:uncharacterized protein YfaT (DUF1175 family)